MSDLKQADIQELIRYIRKKTKKGPGYVWDFNDLTFREFVNGATGCNIDDKKYKTNGTSKEKRLREFLTIEENSKVKLLLEELLDYGTRRKFLLTTHIKNMKKIINNLKKYEKNIEINENTIKNKNEERILLKEIKDKISKGQYEFAIDRLHTLLKYKYEAIFKSIKKDLKGKTLDTISGELNNILRVNNVFKESTTFSILSATKKIMKELFDEYAAKEKATVGEAMREELEKDKEAHTKAIQINIDTYKLFRQESKEVLDEIHCQRVAIYLFHNGNSTPYGYPFAKITCAHDYTSHGTIGTIRGENQKSAQRPSCFPDTDGRFP